MYITKRICALALSLACLLGCLAGCSKEPGPVVEPGASGTNPQGADSLSTAMGRYVEQTVTLPDFETPLDLVSLTTGELRVAVQHEDGRILLYTSGDGGESWETSVLPQQLLSAGYVEDLVLSPDGSVFCSHVLSSGDEGAKEYTFTFWVMDPDGAWREIPVTYPDANKESYLVTSCDFTSDGRLMAIFRFDDLRQVDLQTGELGENRNELGIFSHAMACAGEDTYIMRSDAIGVVRGETMEAYTGVAADQILSALVAYDGYADSKVTLWQNEDGYLFFTTHEGLYSFAPGGSVVEELVSGARTSLGDPSVFPKAMTGTGDGVFYVLCGGWDGCALYRYTYDENTPTVPGCNLRLYTLYEDERLRQMVSLYQKANPDISIDIEVGITETDGVTREDAIRTLNTQILAGSGPDLICLDGLNLDTYLEKGLLADLSAYLDQAGPLLDQVARCYATGGQVMAVPTIFSLPTIYGPEHLVSGIHDMASLVAAITQARQENPKARSAVNGFMPLLTADEIYDSCSAAWVNSDGSLSEEALAEFYSGLQEIYALDAGMREELGDDLIAQYMADYTPGDFTFNGGPFYIITNAACVSLGTTDGMDSWTTALGGEELLDGSYSMTLLNVQAPNVFLPRRIMGILSTSGQQAAAGAFVTYLLSQETQLGSLNGFPVNQAAFDQVIAEDKATDTVSVFSSSDSDETITIHHHYPDAASRQQLKSWTDALTTPALTDRTIREKVMAQLDDCLNGRITAQEAAAAAVRDLNLYLNE